LPSLTHLFARDKNKNQPGTKRHYARFTEGEQGKGKRKKIHSQANQSNGSKPDVVNFL